MFKRRRTHVASAWSKHFKRDCVSICLRILNTMQAKEIKERSRKMAFEGDGKNGATMEMDRNCGEEQNRMDMHVNMFYIENCCVCSVRIYCIKSVHCAVLSSLSIRLLCYSSFMPPRSNVRPSSFESSLFRFSSLSCRTFSIKSNAQYHFDSIK